MVQEIVDDSTLDLEMLCNALLSERERQPVVDGRPVPMNETQVEMLCHRVRSIFAHQPMLLEVDAPMKVAGDIHGQYYDLLRLFEYGGDPKEYNYLFLGDYVDRGKNSLECVSMLFTFKAMYPDNFFVLRGNHECSTINKLYGFFDECKRRFNIKMWKTFGDVFNYMPVCALIDDRILCMHGGLSPELTSLDQIRDLQRPVEVPDTGLLCDLLWSDPAHDVTAWGENDRGVSFTFGAEIVRSVLQKFDLDLIARAHQVVQDGYEFFAGRQLVTVFSAPNYCREFDNAAAVMNVDENLVCSFKVIKPIINKR